MNSNTKFALNSGLKFMAISTRWVTGNWIYRGSGGKSWWSIFSKKNQGSNKTLIFQSKWESSKKPSCLPKNLKPGPVNRIKFLLILWISPPMQRCKKSSGLAKKSQASLENFRTAANAGMPYYIPFDSAVFFFNTIYRDRIKGLTPRV